VKIKYPVLTLSLALLRPLPAAAQPEPEAPTTPQPAPEERPALPTITVSSGGLTSAEVARRTLASSASVRARQAEVEVAAAKVDQTMIQFFPRLTLKATYTRLSPVVADFGAGALVGAANPGVLTTGPCPAGAAECVYDSGGQPVGAAKFSIETIENNYALTAQLTVPLSDYVLRLSNAAAASSSSKRAAEAALRAERLKVQADARVLYYEWVRALARVTAARQSRETVKARHEDVKTAFELGRATRADVLRVEALIANTELLVKEAETFRNLGAKSLAIVMGERGAASYQVGEDVTRASLRAPSGSLDQLTAQALSRRLELRTLEQTQRALAKGARALEAGRWPRLDAFGDATYANPNQRYFPPQQQWQATWAVGLQATWLVNDTFGSAAGAAELDASARAIEAQRQALKDGIRREVAAAFLDRERARVAIQTSRRALSAAEEAYRVSTDLFRAGSATTTELIQAEGELLNVRLAHIDAHLSLRIADVRLWHATGEDVRGKLAAP
jgi:outer membrane protein